MAKNDGPYMPMTVSLYRTVAFKMFKRQFSNTQNPTIYASFCQKVDRELLDKQFYFEIVKQYHRKIQQHKLNSDLFEKMPTQFQANFEQLQTSDQYGRLIETVAQWFSLIELCEDLVERIQLYGIFNYLSGDEQYVVEKLRKNWKIIDQEDQSSEKKVVKAKGYASSALSYVFNQSGQFLQQLGIFGAAHGVFSRYCWGFATVHPGYFMTAILTSVLVKMQAETLQQNTVLSEIDLVTEHFRVVTSNLMNQYLAGS